MFLFFFKFFFLFFFFVLYGFITCLRANFFFFIHIFSGTRVFVLQFVNSNDDLINCQVILEKGLVLNDILFTNDLKYADVANREHAVLKIASSKDSLFELKLGVYGHSSQKGIDELCYIY